MYIKSQLAGRILGNQQKNCFLRSFSVLVLFAQLKWLRTPTKATVFMTE